eukprot:5820331-Pyramimonas_sp.AAC.1
MPAPTATAHQRTRWAQHADIATTSRTRYSRRCSWLGLTRGPSSTNAKIFGVCWLLLIASGCAVVF